MSESAKRVVLISKPGQAEARMQGMLADGGVDVALSLDPGQGDPAQIVQAAPDAVVVLLDPGIEEALERFQGLLRDRSLTVIYDEAELTLSRQGWDAARWMRHLLAKLHHHDDVLPPRQGDGSGSAVCAAVTPQPAPAAVAPALADPPSTVGAEAALDVPSDADLTFDADVVDTVDSLDIEPISLADLDLPREAAPAADVGSDDADEYAWKPPELDSPADAPTGLDELLRSLQAEPTAHLPSSPEPTSEDPTAAAAATHAPDLASHDIASHLSLADADAAPAPVATPSTGSPSAAVLRNLDDLESRIAHLQLVDEEDAAPAIETPPAATPSAAAAIPSGAVWVLAGIGGPDAIRHLVSGLPSEFDRPVLIQQKLEGARHDKLVQQLERISSLPVELAQPGAAIAAGRIYILASATGVHAPPDAAWQFDGQGDRMPALDASQTSRCAVVVLSGADPQQSAAMAGLAATGALLLAQTPDSCFDAQGAGTAIAAGAHPLAPDQIAVTLSNWATMGVRP